MKISAWKNQITIIICVFIVAMAILSSTWFLSNTKFYIRDSSGGVTKDGEIINTINVTGNGKIYAKPDVVIFNVSVTETKNTSKEAIEAVNTKINEAKKLIKGNGIEDKYIKTTNLSIYTEYDWSGSTKKVVGQRATQSIEVTIPNVDETSSKVTDVIDQLVEIENVQLGWIRFDIEDKTEYFTQARELAYKKAEQKAKELASLGGLELLAPVSISDATVDYNSAQYNSVNSYKASLIEDESSSTDISTGQLEINVSLDVKFGISPK